MGVGTSKGMGDPASQPPRLIADASLNTFPGWPYRLPSAPISGSTPESFHRDDHCHHESTETQS